MLRDLAFQREAQHSLPPSRAAGGIKMGYALQERECSAVSSLCFDPSLNCFIVVVKSCEFEDKPVKPGRLRAHKKEGPSTRLVQIFNIDLNLSFSNASKFVKRFSSIAQEFLSTLGKPPKTTNNTSRI